MKYFDYDILIYCITVIYCSYWLWLVILILFVTQHENIDVLKKNNQRGDINKIYQLSMVYFNKLKFNII